MKSIGKHRVHFDHFMDNKPTGSSSSVRAIYEKDGEYYINDLAHKRKIAGNPADGFTHKTHVMTIQSRSFDDILGDLVRKANGAPVNIVGLV